MQCGEHIASFRPRRQHDLLDQHPQSRRRLQPFVKALIRKAATRRYDVLWQAVGNVCNLFTDEECYNFFKAAGYRTD